MKNVDLIIKARWCLSLHEDHSVPLEQHSLVIDDGLIVALLPEAEAVQQYQAAQTVDLPQHCLMPGLINNHGHSAMTLFRGLADDLPLMTWLNKHIWPAEKQFVSDHFVETGSTLAIAEMLRSGTTCFSDMYFFPEATARVVDRTGIRASLGMVVIELPTAWAQDASDYLHKGQQLHDQYRLHTLINTHYAPHAPYTVSDKTLETLIMNAEEMDLPIQMHIHETAAEIHESLQQYGVRPLERLQSLGLLSPRLNAVHMTQLRPEEIETCAEAGIHIVHCPSSNLKLASGFTPIAALAEQGVNITLGTDGAASNNTLDMLAETRQAALLAKAVASNAGAVPARSALQMATLNAAKALGLDQVCGSLAAGKAADVIAIDLGDLETQPLYDVYSQLVYATGRDKVTDVWVAGKQLLKQRQLTTIDTQQLQADVRQWSQKIRSSR